MADDEDVGVAMPLPLPLPALPEPLRLALVGVAIGDGVELLLLRFVCDFHSSVILIERDEPPLLPLPLLLLLLLLVPNEKRDMDGDRLCKPIADGDAIDDDDDGDAVFHAFFGD